MFSRRFSFSKYFYSFLQLLYFSSIYDSKMLSQHFYDNTLLQILPLVIRQGRKRPVTAHDSMYSFHPSFHPPSTLYPLIIIIYEMNENFTPNPLPELKRAYPWDSAVSTALTTVPPPFPPCLSRNLSATAANRHPNPTLASIFPIHSLGPAG